MIGCWRVARLRYKVGPVDGAGALTMSFLLQNHCVHPPKVLSYSGLRWSRVKSIRITLSIGEDGEILVVNFTRVRTLEVDFTARASLKSHSQSPLTSPSTRGTQSCAMRPKAMGTGSGTHTASSNR